MRLWMDDQNRMLTDEQLLRQIAHHGSLADSLDHGNVRLVADESGRSSVPREKTSAPERSLADYL